MAFQVIFPALHRMAGIIGPVCHANGFTRVSDESKPGTAAHVGKPEEFLKMTIR